MTASLLMTDGYKFSMAEAGWPLRRETFYWSHRRGGPQVLPFDARAEVLELLPEVTPADLAYLEQQGYDLDFRAFSLVGKKAATDYRFSLEPLID